MKRRSQLRHTSMDNGLAFLFESGHRTGTLAVLQGTASQADYRKVRSALERWEQTTRPAVLKNLSDFEEAYSPFEEGLQTLRKRMVPGDWRKLSKLHYANVRRRLEINQFVDSVRTAVDRFDHVLESVRAGRIGLDSLKKMHIEMVDDYRTF